MSKKLCKADLSDYVALIDSPPIIKRDNNGFVLLQRGGGQQGYAVVAYNRLRDTYWCYHEHGENAYDIHWFNTSGKLLERVRKDEPSEDTFESYNKFYRELMEMFT